MSFTPEQLEQLKKNAEKVKDMTSEQATELLLRIGIIDIDGNISANLREDIK